MILGHTGHLSLEAIRWCSDTGIVLTQLDTDGRLLLTAGAAQFDDPRLRRAQAAAATNPVGVDIARALLTAKLQGQASVAASLGASLAAVQIRRLAEQLGHSQDLPGLRGVEAQASNTYFAAWATHANCRFAEHHHDRVPDHWEHFSARTSPLKQGGSSPRIAADPINALLNYTYTLAEAECRLALQALGLDPGLGVVHTDKKNRDSLALDLLEPLRPVAEQHVLQLLTARFFTTDDFYETAQGSCRLLPPLTHLVAQALPELAVAVAPMAEGIAHALAHSSPGPVRLRTPLSRSNYSAAQTPGSRSTTRRPPGTTGVLPTCQTCGTQLYDRRRQLCTACWPVTRNAHAQLRNAASHAARATAIAEGRDPTQTTAARTKRRDSLLAAKAAEATWTANASVSPITEKELRDRVLPALGAVSLNLMQQATGLANSSCSRIRRGLMTPHPRHWQALALLGEQVPPQDLTSGAPASAGVSPAGQASVKTPVVSS